MSPIKTQTATRSWARSKELIQGNLIRWVIQFEISCCFLLASKAFANEVSLGKTPIWAPNPKNSVREKSLIVQTVIANLSADILLEGSLGQEQDVKINFFQATGLWLNVGCWTKNLQMQLGGSWRFCQTQLWSAKHCGDKDRMHRRI